jgi:hypothetical protein
MKYKIYIKNPMKNHNEEKKDSGVIPERDLLP